MQVKEVSIDTGKIKWHRFLQQQQKNHENPIFKLCHHCGLFFKLNKNIQKKLWKYLNMAQCFLYYKAVCDKCDFLAKIWIQI